MSTTTTVDLSLLASDDDDNNGDEQVYKLKSSYNILNLGNPLPKPSPRFNSKFRGFKPKSKQAIIQTWTRNELSKEMKAFQGVCRAQLQEQLGTGGTFPIYKKKVTVDIKIWFCRRPPDTCFVNSDRTRPKGALLMSQKNATPYCIYICPDTDNLLKFVLDSLKSVAWEDDNQVGCITAYKCHDCYPPFDGRTAVVLSKATLVMPLPIWATEETSTLVKPVPMWARADS